MNATGIGASIRRKEDLRFITGKGRYTDDISRPGQSHAFFLRSPHAHATIDRIDISAAQHAHGVIAIFTGDDIAADKLGGLICGWMIHSKDGSPMKAGAHPALAQGKVRYVGDHVAVVIAETVVQARDAAERIVVDYTVLPAVTDTAAANIAGGPVIHDIAPDNTVYRWHLGDETATKSAFARAAHVTKLEIVNNRLVPNAMEPRSAVGDYDEGTESFTLYTTRQNPHVARLVLSAFIGIAPENRLRSKMGSSSPASHSPSLTRPITRSSAIRHRVTRSLAYSLSRPVRMSVSQSPVPAIVASSASPISKQHWQQILPLQRSMV